MSVSTLTIRGYIEGLSGRRLGAFKAAAAKLGIRFDEYVSRLEAGQKSCIDCRQWKDRGQFNVDASRWDGLAAKCRDCSSLRGRESHEPVPAELLAKGGPDRRWPVAGDKLHARHLINLEVIRKRRPNPNDLYCAMCGHKGSDRRHEYHHHMGYSAEHVYDVVALCTTCHHKEDQGNGHN